MSGDTPAKVAVVWLCHYMMNPHSILCKVNASSGKLFLLFEAHSSFRFQYRLLTITTFFEIAVGQNKGLIDYKVSMRVCATVKDKFFQ